jgi:hypothetical protein
MFLIQSKVEIFFFRIRNNLFEKFHNSNE